MYGCDAAWWRFREGLSAFNGFKICHDGNGLDYPGLLKVKIKRDGREFSDELQFSTDTIGGGGNSGFQALNLVALFGGSPVFLVGFDMLGAHWYGRNTWPGANNPIDRNFHRWMAAFGRAAPVLKDRGISVFNLSPLSALKCFPRITVDQAIERIA